MAAGEAQEAEEAGAEAGAEAGVEAGAEAGAVGAALGDVMWGEGLGARDQHFPGPPLCEFRWRIGQKFESRVTERLLTAADQAPGHALHAMLQLQLCDADRNGCNRRKWYEWSYNYDERASDRYTAVPELFSFTERHDRLSCTATCSILSIKVSITISAAFNG